MSGELPHTGGPLAPSGMVYLIVGGIGTVGMLLASQYGRLKTAGNRFLGR